MKFENTKWQSVLKQWRLSILRDFISEKKNKIIFFIPFCFIFLFKRKYSKCAFLVQIELQTLIFMFQCESKKTMI